MRVVERIISLHFLSDLKIPRLSLPLLHSLSLLAVRDALRSVPDENGALSSNTHDESLVRGDLDLYKYEVRLFNNSNFGLTFEMLPE